MIRNILLMVAFFIPIVSNAQEEIKSIEQSSKYGLLIENGPNQGIPHTDTLGNEYNYRYNTSIISNESSITTNIQITLSNEYNFPASCEEGDYKLFLLPEELTPDTVTLYNNIFTGLNTFLDKCLDDPYVLNKTLEPGEKHVVTIGRLISKPPKCGIFPTKLLVKGDSLFFGSDSRAIQIPCGLISYPEN